MAKVNINKDRCKGCQFCIVYCPKGLLKKPTKLNKLGVHPVIFTGEDEACIGCGFCVIMCPDCCIEINK